MKNSYLICVLSIIVLFVIYYQYFLGPKKICDNGYFLIKKILDEDMINEIKDMSNKNNYSEIKIKIFENKKLKEFIKDNLGEKYVFQDYIWVIKKSFVHTCHRDNNSKYFNKGQKHRSYTMLIYLEDMQKCLSVVPLSHSNNNVILNFNPILDIYCNKGDAIIFDANLIHVGSFNKSENNLRLQFKISHVDDIDHLKYYQNFNKILNKEASTSRYLRYLQKNISCTLPIMSDISQTDNISSARGSSKGVKISMGQKIFSYLFYGDKDYYDLPDAELT